MKVRVGEGDSPHKVEGVHDPNSDSEVLLDENACVE